MRLLNPGSVPPKNAWYVEFRSKQVRLGSHPENAPAPKKGKTGWNPPQ
jgi:hypothetical protein